MPTPVARHPKGYHVPSNFCPCFSLLLFTTSFSFTYEKRYKLAKCVSRAIGSLELGKARKEDRSSSLITASALEPNGRSSMAVCLVVARTSTTGSFRSLMTSSWGRSTSYENLNRGEIGSSYEHLNLHFLTGSLIQRHGYYIESQYARGGSRLS